MKQFPSFSLPASDCKIYTEADFATGITVAYIYPKDMTSGCTIEAHDFQKALPDFQKLGARVFGISKDSLDSHQKFCDKESLSFPLLSDENMELLKSLDTWKEKSMYGRKYFGADRSTFLIVDGKIIQEWRKLSVSGHVESVFDAVKSL
jgi:peroxiredoxin Q/BCP